MAPRRRPKVGSSRMDAALDAMRPMGFSSSVVRKCVKNLLKVYGNEGWVVIEEAAYALLIDTLLEEPVIERLEHEPQNLLLEEPVIERSEHEPQNLILEGGSQSQAADHEDKPKPVQELITSDKNVVVEDEKTIARETHGDGIIKVKREEENGERGSVINVTPMLLQDEKAQHGFDLACTPKSSDIINLKKRSRRPCFGWISDNEDDEDDEFLQLTPAKSVESCWMKKN